MLQTSFFEVEQQRPPGLLRLAKTIIDREALLAPVRGDAEDDEQALPVGSLTAQPGVDAVDPPVDVAGR